MTLKDLGAPVGHPPFKVLPYGAVGEGCGAWDDSDDAASDDLEEDFVDLVSTILHPRFRLCNLLAPWRPPSPILLLHSYF